MIYLYRAVALEYVDNAHEDTICWPGMSLGRGSGYLSRSSAKNAGIRSGFEFKLVRSAPVKFPVIPEVEVAELREQINELRAARA